MSTKNSKKITVEVSDTVYQLLQVLADGGAFEGRALTVEDIVDQLIDHAQQGVYRPGAWERDWLCQAFGDEWIELLEPGDPYGRPDSPMFQRPRAQVPTQARPRRRR